LAGHGIKQTIPYKKVGVVSQEEVDWLSTTYPNGEASYKSMRDLLDSPKKSLKDLRSIPDRNKQLSNSIQSPGLIHESVTRGRFAALNEGISRRDQIRENRKPIADRLANMDTVAKWAVMHPLFLKGRRFTFHEDQIAGLQARNPAVISGIDREIKRFTDSEPDPSLRRMAQIWFRDQLAVLVPSTGSE
jgi:hypothetical protein